MTTTMLFETPTVEELEAMLAGSHPSITAEQAHEACREARKRLEKLDAAAWTRYKEIRWQLKPGKKQGKATLESKRAAYVYAFERLAAFVTELAAFAAIGPKATPLYKPCGSATH